MSPTRPRNPRRAAPVLALLAAALLSACGGGRSDEVGHGVLLIAVDALRADHVGALGYDRDTTPHLDALAERGVLFESALAGAPTFAPAMAALLSGCDPNLARRHLPGLAPEGVTTGTTFAEPLPSLAVELAVAGFDTAAFVDADRFEARIGFERGFHDFVRVERDELDQRGPLDLAAEWVRSREQDEPWFCFVHLSDLLRAFEEPHPEWDGFFEGREELEWIPPVGANEVNFHAVPPSRWEGGTVAMARYEARYDGAVRRLDGALRRLFDLLEGGGRYKRTTVCVVGTHGLQLGEAGMLLDHGLLSAADVRVPFVLRPATRLAVPFTEGARRDELVSLVDVAPTLLSLAGVEPPERMHGLDLTDRLAEPPGPGARERVVVVSCGILAGTAAYGDQLVLEHLVPGFGVPPALLEQWLGGGAAGGLEVRCYPWRDPDARPLLSGPDPPAGHEAEHARLARVQAEWFESFLIPEHQRFWGAP